MRAASVSVSRATNAATTKSDALLELIDGLLLGDGSLEGNQKSARLVLNQTARHRPWINQVRDALVAAGFRVAVGTTRAGTTTIRGKHYRRTAGLSLRTSYDASLGKQRARWYPRGVKRVPQDIRLSPVSIAHWYFGDGTVGCKGYHAKFCTDGFTRRDVRALVRALKGRFGWRPLVEERNRILLCKMADRVSLVEMLRAQRIPTCFRHKLRLRLHYRTRIIVGAVEDRLRTLRQHGHSYSQISVELKLSKSGVWDACQRLGIG